MPLAFLSCSYSGAPTKQAIKYRFASSQPSKREVQWHSHDSTLQLGHNCGFAFLLHRIETKMLDWQPSFLSPQPASNIFRYRDSSSAGLHRSHTSLVSPHHLELGLVLQFLHEVLDALFHNWVDLIRFRWSNLDARSTLATKLECTFSSIILLAPLLPVWGTLLLGRNRHLALCGPPVCFRRHPS